MHAEFCRSSRLIAVATLAALMTIDAGLGSEREPNAQRGKTNARSRRARHSENGQTTELFGTAWFDSLEGAGKAVGRGRALDKGKPIFCLRVLGDLGGFM